MDDFWLRATCRAGALVLLIGFAFDGGLFKLATGSVFWILLELGRESAVSSGVGAGRFIPNRGAPDTTSNPGLTPRSVWTAPGLAALWRGPQAVRQQEPVPALHTLARYCASLAKRGVRCELGQLALRLSGSWAIPLLVVTALITGMVWAKARDPFRRVSLSVKTADGKKAAALAVLPKSKEPLPVVIYAHGSGGDVMKDGNTLRAFAEQGLAAVSFEYDQSDQANFDAQMRRLLEKLSRQKWARSNAVAWVGHSLGAQSMLSFLLRHPHHEPQVQVRLNGGWVEEMGGKAEIKPSAFNAQPSALNPQLSTNLTIWLIHGENDRVFPAEDVRRLAKALEAGGTPVRLDMFPNLGHGFGPDRQGVVRAVAEFCAQRFSTVRPVQVNVRPTLWWYWLPFGALVMGLGFVALRRPFMDSITHGKRVLSVVALSTAMLAIADTAIHLGVPQMRASPRLLEFTRSWLVRPELRADYDWLTGQPGSANRQISVLLQHLDLGHYNRSLVNWKIDEALYREFVLSPWIEPETQDIGWRRKLWEAFYPRIRRESDPRAAAETVARFLRERVTITNKNMPCQSIPEIWASGMTDTAGFERIYTAALRSVGIATHLDANRQAEMWNGSRWQRTPEPLIKTVPSSFKKPN